MEEEKQQIEEKILKCTEQIMQQIAIEGIRCDNVDFLFKVVDIHKDLKNEIYWKEKLDMRYREYNDGNYGRRARDSRGRYMEGNSYGRRGVPGTGRGRYRGEEILDEIMEKYQDYSDNHENYGADNETMGSYKQMIKSFKDFFKHLKKEAVTPEQMDMLEETAREMFEK